MNPSSSLRLLENIHLQGVWNNAYEFGFPNAHTQKIIDITDPVYVAQQTGTSPIPDSLTNGPFDSAYLMQTTTFESSKCVRACVCVSHVCVCGRVQKKMCMK